MIKPRCCQELLPYGGPHCTAFHPQMDGVSEHTICTMAQILQAMVQPDQHNWVEKVPMVKYAINSSISNSTGFAPFELNYGHMPVMMS